LDWIGSAEINTCPNSGLAIRGYDDGTSTQRVRLADDVQLMKSCRRRRHQRRPADGRINEHRSIIHPVI